MLKFVGISAASLSIALLGACFGNKDRLRIDDLNALKLCLSLLKSQIAYALNALPESFDTLAERGGERLAPFWASMADKLRQKTGEPLSNLWRDAARALTATTALTEQDASLMSRLPNLLGLSDPQTQTENINFITQSIDARLDELRPQYAKNAKLYRSLGILGGLAAAIMLV